ncbi:MAG: dephospho-CoA kinase [Bryobacteraceae bacterium]|nr:dephospho-CoA kinase [Bryobacteraceae bacterium]MDW8377037.1 dephospho-CoA kinase [Bryobacterales bacterium]
MLRVALTGGLASGKSFVGRILAEQGCRVIQADALGHQVLAPRGEAYAEVVHRFGSGILNEEGQIDRRKLAEIVFGNPEKLALLNSLVHPPVRKRIAAALNEFELEQPNGISVVEAAIHVETGSYQDYDRLIVAYCSPELQIQRAMHRDNLSRAEVEARLSQQMPLAMKRKYAHFVIDTSATKEETAHMTKRVFCQLRSIRQ